MSAEGGWQKTVTNLLGQPIDAQSSVSSPLGDIRVPQLQGYWCIFIANSKKASNYSRSRRVAGEKCVFLTPFSKGKGLSLPTPPTSSHKKTRRKILIVPRCLKCRWRRLPTRFLEKALAATSRRLAACSRGLCPGNGFLGPYV